MENIVASRLDSLDNHIRGTFDRHTYFEVEECEKAINSRTGRIEYVLGAYRVDSPANIADMLGKLKRNLRQIKNIIEDCRDEEKRGTISNLQQTSIQLEEAIQGLERFEQEGIELTGQRDIAYADSVKGVIDSETDRFISENGITDKRVIEELKAEMKGLHRSLATTHGELSARMKYTMKAKVNEIGKEFVARREVKTQSEKQAEGIPGIEGLKADEKDVNQYYMKSENERAFREIEQPAQDSKSNNESLFK